MGNSSLDCCRCINQSKSIPGATLNKANKQPLNKGSYLWLWWYPPPLVCQSASPESVTREVLTKICWTSRQPRLGLAWRMRATTPATKGAAADVPPKEAVQSVMVLKINVRWKAKCIINIINGVHVRSSRAKEISSGDRLATSTARGTSHQCSTVLTVVGLFSLKKKN